MHNNTPYQLLPDEVRGHLTVIRQDGVDCLVECDCGRIILLPTRKIATGRITGCGCRRGGHNRLNRTPLYKKTKRIWYMMHHRCQNVPGYVGRGIYVCDRWSVFDAFLEDMGECPSDDHSIERIDNDGIYCLENCCWILLARQVDNQRRSVKNLYKLEAPEILRRHAEGQSQTQIAIDFCLSRSTIDRILRCFG